LSALRESGAKKPASTGKDPKNTWPSPSSDGPAKQNFRRSGGGSPIKNAQLLDRPGAIRVAHDPTAPFGDPIGKAIEWGVGLLVGGAAAAGGAAIHFLQKSVPAGQQTDKDGSGKELPKVNRDAGAKNNIVNFTKKKTLPPKDDQNPACKLEVRTGRFQGLLNVPLQTTVQGKPGSKTGFTQEIHIPVMDKWHPVRIQPFDLSGQVIQPLPVVHNTIADSQSAVTRAAYSSNSKEAHDHTVVVTQIPRPTDGLRSYAMVNTTAFCVDPKGIHRVEDQGRLIELPPTQDDGP
jgi:hypothetical protein